MTKKSPDLNLILLARNGRKQGRFLLAEILNVEGKCSCEEHKRQMLHHMHNLQFKFSTSTQRLFELKPIDWFVPSIKLSAAYLKFSQVEFFAFKHEELALNFAYLGQ